MRSHALRLATARYGASYKQSAAVAYKAGMSKEPRVEWYRIAGSIPLSMRHAGHVLSRLQEGAAA